MSWQDILKNISDKEHITWLSEKKLQAWVNGKGPYDVEEINAMIRKDPDNYIESVSKDDSPMDKVTSTTSTGQDEEAAKRTEEKESELLAQIRARNAKARGSDISKIRLPFGKQPQGQPQQQARQPQKVVMIVHEDKREETANLLRQLATLGAIDSDI